MLHLDGHTKDRVTARRLLVQMSLCRLPPSGTPIQQVVNLRNGFHRDFLKALDHHPVLVFHQPQTRFVVHPVERPVVPQRQQVRQFLVVELHERGFNYQGRWNVGVVMCCVIRWATGQVPQPKRRSGECMPCTVPQRMDSQAPQSPADGAVDTPMIIVTYC